MGKSLTKKQLRTLMLADMQLEFDMLKRSHLEGMEDLYDKVLESVRLITASLCNLEVGVLTTWMVRRYEISNYLGDNEDN